jgi:hypothetical protein
MQFDGDVEAFARWCASTRSVSRFVAALREVPEDQWTRVVARLNAVIDHRAGRKLEAFGEVCAERIPY